jgi:carbonic anhydrase
MKKQVSFFVAMLLLFSVAVVYGSSERSGISADEALKKLREGNALFVSGAPSNADFSINRRRETAKGQKPYVTILGCSDSRESLEHIFGAGIGELFVIRVAGNVADTDEIGSIEYGVEHLGTPILLVLGHSSCGAVTAVVTGAEVHGHIPSLVDNILPAVDSARKVTGSNTSKDVLIERSINENIFQSMHDILSKSHIIAQSVKEGRVRVIGALYHLDSGTIDWLGEHPDQNTLVSQALMGEDHNSGNAGAILLKASTIIMAISIIFFFFFIAEKRIFKSLKFRARLALSFLASILSLGVAITYSFDLYRSGGSNAWLLIVVPVLLTFAVSVIITGALVSSFKRFYEQSMQRLMGAKDQ